MKNTTKLDYETNQNAPSLQGQRIFFPTTITIRGEEVELEWDNDGDCLGKATCTVLASDLDEGSAGGPVDGETFTIGGKKYKLGEHDYSREGDLVACTARIYAAEDFD